MIIASTRGNIVIMTKCTLMFRFPNISDCIGDCNTNSPLCILHKLLCGAVVRSLKFRSEFGKRKIYFSTAKVILHMHNVQCQVFQNCYLYLVERYCLLNECSIWRDRRNYARNFRHRILDYEPRKIFGAAESCNLIVKYH